MKQNEASKQKKFNQSRISQGFSPSKSVCSDFSQSGYLENGCFIAVNNSNKLDFNEFKSLLSVIATLIFPENTEEDAYLALVSVLLSLNFQKYKL